MKLPIWVKTGMTRISPRLNTEVLFFLKFHRPLNLKNPRTFDEKLQWLKLNYYPKQPLISQCADKYRVREYVEDCGCPEILNELYGAYDNVDEIPWNDLPDSFVIKWNFGCGQNIIVRDKSKLNIEETKNKLQSWYGSRKTAYMSYSELQYKPIKPKIIIEKLIDTEDGELPIDYKLYCYNGKIDCVMLCYGRGKLPHPVYYMFDRDGNIKRYNKTGAKAPEGFKLEDKPANFDKLFHYAEVLSKPFPFVRADFYLEKGKVIFGELTFTPCGGMDTNYMPEGQLTMGDMIQLPK